ncbi:MAG TPA: MFS transporter [Steroidobacteraceae bacterium]
MRSLRPGAGEEDYPSRPYAWSVVVVLIATAVLSYTDRQVLSLLVDPIRRDLHITDTGISLLLGTAFAVVYGIAGIPLGALADRTSRRNLIFAGVLVWSCGTLACGFSRTFIELFAARIVVGLGEAVLSPAAISLISDYFPPSRRGTAVGCFLSGIAMGIGASILIGGGVLHAVQAGALSHTALAAWPAWRLVLLAIGFPGVLWAFAVLWIREPLRRTSGGPAPQAGEGPLHGGAWGRVTLIYLVVASASLVDNAVGAWAPTLLIREFSRDPAQIGVQLGLLLTAGFGGGVLLGGWLADRAGARAGWSAKLGVCLGAGLLILPVSLAIDAGVFAIVLLAVPLYFALSGIVTACGFSAILDAVPNRSRGLAMSISFFLNVALGAGLGPTAVALASERIFGAPAGLAPAITLTVAGGYGLAIVALLVALAVVHKKSRSGLR